MDNKYIKPIRSRKKKEREDFFTHNLAYLLPASSRDI